MPDQPAPPPPAYQPAYAMAPAPTQTASTGVKLPSWLNLWDLIGLLIILVGAILILVGFLFGDAGYAAESASPPVASTIQGDFEAFFVWAGVGIFLTILGYLFRVMLPMFMGRKRAAPAASEAPATPTAHAAPVTMAPAAPPQPAPVAAPAAPACANCGKPTTYIAQYGRYYCYACARYV
ncbi:MAG: hypothetical protein WB786_03415 [Thermoplasmata archaeon]